MVEKKREDEGGVTYEFISSNEKKIFREQIQKQILVVYRATPKDKHMLVAAI